MTLICNPEWLQAFLDHELDPEACNQLKKHLAGCRSCRQELSQLKLLWLELSHSEPMVVPPELSYLRQQVLESTRASRTKSREDSFSYWGTQKLAWQSLTLATAYLPGAGKLKEIPKSAGREVPGFLLGSLTHLGGLCRKIYLRKQDSGVP